MMFDLDDEDSYFAHEKANLPKPTITCVNRSNGHAHIAYGLRAPICRSENANINIYHYFQDIRLGYTRRLGADVGYSALLFKNPFHSQWESEWTNYLYDLGELDDYLEKEDKKYIKVCPELNPTLGRHCFLFELVRHFAYSNLFKYKKENNWNGFHEIVQNFAFEHNAEFIPPMRYDEVNGIVNRICHWAWRNMNIKAYSKKQSTLGKKAWSKTRTLSREAPWEDLGISRRTFYNKGLHLNFERTKLNGQVTA